MRACPLLHNKSNPATKPSIPPEKISGQYAVPVHMTSIAGNGDLQAEKSSTDFVQSIQNAADSVKVV